MGKGALREWRSVKGGRLRPVEQAGRFAWRRQPVRNRKLPACGFVVREPASWQLAVTGGPGGRRASALTALRGLNYHSPGCNVTQAGAAGKRVFRNLNILPPRTPANRS